MINIVLYPNQASISIKNLISFETTHQKDITGTLLRFLKHFYTMIKQPQWEEQIAELILNGNQAQF